MRCEVCGRKIYGNPIRAAIEGARLTVCVECSKHGRIIKEEPRQFETTKRGVARPFPSMVQKKKPAAKVEITQELVEDYDSQIRQGREKIGLTHEELGKKINEKESVLRKLETRKMKPNNLLITKLEHALKIKLLVPISEDKGPQQIFASPSREPTLGDLIKLNKKGAEEPTERKP